MNQPPSSADATALPPVEPATSANDLDSIRDLLFGEEKRQLDVLQGRIEDPRRRANDVSRVLPQAIILASGRDEQLAGALTPAVESALQASVKRDPSILANAVFPIIGPAIRKSIAETLSKLVQSLNQTLEHSLSLQGLKWRLEAARTGKSFAEVVMAHTLVYRVEQVFLIHRKTGLLLQQITAPHIRSKDADMVSGMLTAIQDFAQDSFRVSAGEALHTMQIGELTVWVELGPLAKLAAVIRGHAPSEFRTVLQSALEHIHREQGAALESFEGDAAPFELVRPHLEACLQVQFAEAARKKSSTMGRVLAGVVLALLAVWLVFSIREKRRWAGFLERLKTEPGIVVTETGKRSGKYFVAGLRDPLATDPAGLLPEFKLKPEKVASRWKPYQALSPGLVLKRATNLLRPPAGVTLRAQDGVLFANGRAPGAWIESARTRATMLPGIHAYDDSGLSYDTREMLAARQQVIEQTVVFFEEDLRLGAGHEAAIGPLAAQLNELGQTALRSGGRVRVSVIGHSDKTGTDEQISSLSRQRAELVANLLATRGVPSSLLTTTGVGAREPWQPDSPEQDPRNRRVTFRVVQEQTGTP